MNTKTYPEASSHGEAQPHRPPCKFCGSSAVVKFGKYRDSQRWWCKACRRKFADNGAMPGRRVPPSEVGTAISLFYKGLSYKDVSEQMRTLYGYAPSKATLYEWVQQYSSRASKEVSGQKVHTGKVWVADEVFIKADKGKQLYVFDVMDADSRYLLATNVSETRGAKDARALFQRAIAPSSNAPHVKIMTANFVPNECDRIAPTAEARFLKGPRRKS